MPNQQEFNHPTDFNQSVTDFILQMATTEIATKDAFYLAISGGSTPLAIFDLLATQKESLDWKKVHIFWVDERCVPADSPESNFGNAYERWLRYVPACYYPIPANGKGKKKIAKHYEQLIREKLPENAQNIPEFDLIWLGMGSDGHTASLFPDSLLLNEKEQLVGVQYVEKLSSKRMTMTFPLINAAKKRLISITGEEKKAIFSEIQSLDAVKYPIQNVISNEETLWMIGK